VDDKTLIERLKSDQTRNLAFHELIKRYEKRVYHHIRKMVIDHDDTDDLVQETFVKVFEHLDHFREESGLYTWIYRIATNEALSFLSKKKRRAWLLLQNYSSQLSQKAEAHVLLDGDAMQAMLQKALLSLPDKQRLVFNMKYYDDMTYKEISAVLGTSVGALKASFHHAVKKIEAHLGSSLNQTP
jgi:RNA polymerase sigma factor (sigma-70 family)